MPYRLILFIALLTLPLAGSAQWQQLYSGTKAEINDIYFLTEKIGYAVSQNAILKTINRGETWQEIVTNEALKNLMEVVVTGDSVHAYGYMQDGKPCKVSLRKNGSRYTIVAIPKPIDSPQYVDGELYYLEEGILLHRNRDKSDTLLLDVLAFQVRHSDVVAILQNEVYHSRDKGATWESRPINTERLPSAPKNLYFDFWPDPFTIVEYRKDQSNSRQSLEGSSMHLALGSLIYHIDNEIGKSSSVVYVSIDSGKSFYTDTLPYHLTDLYCFQDSIAYVYGSDGSIYNFRPRNVKYKVRIPDKFIIISDPHTIMRRTILNRKGDVLRVSDHYSTEEFINIPTGKYTIRIEWISKDHSEDFEVFEVKE